MPTSHKGRIMDVTSNSLSLATIFFVGVNDGICMSFYMSPHGDFVASHARPLRRYSLWSTLVVFLLLLFLAACVSADCECGYSSVVNGSRYVFTDLIESDFLHIADVPRDTDWVRQGYNVTARVSRGVYGTAFEVDNVVGNPLVDGQSWSGPAVAAGAPGLQLWVDGGRPADGLVPTSEMDSARTDILWGSFRASMMLTNVSGTCGAFFWYFNDSQEVDMEFLSEKFNKENNTFPVNLVMQTALSAEQGFQELGKNYEVVNLPFDPTDGYHEYRIDMVPGYVYFHADGAIIGNMTSTTKQPSPGHIILTHWSNGNPGWTYGPPASDAMMAVSYMKAYFNSSLDARQTSFNQKCTNLEASNSICVIPDQKIAPNPLAASGNVSAHTFFFSQQPNSTDGQIVYRSVGTPSEPRRRLFSLMLVTISASLEHLPRLLYCVLLLAGLCVIQNES